MVVIFDPLLLEIPRYYLCYSKFCIIFLIEDKECIFVTLQ